jgi:uncharacterized protein (DUF488 family)
MAATTIYTAGYARLRDPDRLKALAETHNAIVIDVRLRPYTSFTGWSRQELSALLGQQYRWVEAFGNVNHRGGPIMLHDREGGLRQIAPLLATRSVILLCGCADHRTCHRRIVAEALARRTGRPIVHLLPVEEEAATPHQLALF